MFNYEYLKWVKKRKRKNILTKLCQLTLLFCLIVFWQFAANMGWINTFITSSPMMVLKTIFSLISNNNLFIHIGVTVYETIVSFVIGTVIGVFIASIMWWNKFFANVIDPYLTVINSLPKVAFGPILIIWVGANMNSIIVMAILISVFITIINSYQGFVDADYNRLKLFKSLGASKMQTFFKLVLPGSFNTIISSLKISISMSLVGVIMGELLVSKQGLGYLIMYGSQVFNLNLVICSIVILCVVACIMYYLVLLLEKKLVKSD